MWLGLITVSVTGALLVSMVVRGRAGRRLHTRPPAAPELDPVDVADIEARWDVLDADHVRRRDELLVSRLRPLVDRRVPVRVVEAVPGLRLVRIRFADGTAVMGRGEAAGDAGVLASLIRDHSVWPGSCSTDAAGTHLVFDWSGAHRQMSMLVTGLDQPD